MLDMAATAADRLGQILTAIVAGQKWLRWRCDHSDTWSRMMRHNLIPGQTTYV